MEKLRKELLEEIKGYHTKTDFSEVKTELLVNYVHPLYRYNFEIKLKILLEYAKQG